MGVLEIVVSGLCVISVAAADPASPSGTTDSVEIVCPNFDGHRTTLTFPIPAQAGMANAELVMVPTFESLQANQYAQAWGLFDVSGDTVLMKPSPDPLAPEIGYGWKMENSSTTPFEPEPYEKSYLNWIPRSTFIGLTAPKNIHFKFFRMSLPLGGTLHAEELLGSGSSYTHWTFPSKNDQQRVIANRTVYRLTADRVKLEGLGTTPLELMVPPGGTRILVSNDIESVGEAYGQPPSELGHLVALKEIFLGTVGAPKIGTESKFRTGHPICSQVLYFHASTPWP